MHPLVSQHLDELGPVCTKHNVRRLVLFGAAATGSFDPATSDLDVLAEFAPMPPAQHADCYFGLLADLERLFGVAIDLVEPSPIRNPYFRQAVEATQVVLFEAAAGRISFGPISGQC
jgi:predicted nucleotidyltransferase